MKWFEISLTLSGELAEAVSEVINRYAPGSVVIETLGPAIDFSSAESVRLRAFLPIDSDYPQRLQSIKEGFWHLSQINPLPEAEYRTLEEENYCETWKENFLPIEIGERLLVQPDWMTTDRLERIPLIISPEMAFGTGSHPTTQLCLLALEEHLSSGDTVIDVGCGSGILSIAAAKLGASKVLALDNDPVAIENSTKNIKLNQLQNKIEVRLGSLPKNAFLETESKFSVLVANILEKTLTQLLTDGLNECVQPDGVLILSGILEEQSASFLQLCKRHNLQLIEESRMQDWVCLVLAKSEAGAVS